MHLTKLVRTFSKQPGFAAVAIVTLGLGIGSATAIFSVIESVMLKPLPYGAPDRLVMVWGTEGESETSNVSGANLLDWQAENQVFEGVAAFFPQLLTWTGIEIPQQVRGVEVTPNFFDVMGVTMSLGRGFVSEPGAERELVLAHDLWVRRFGADPDTLGRMMSLNKVLYTIVGVAPEGFEIPFEQGEVWTRAPNEVPLPPLDYGMEPEELRGLHWLRAVGRLKPGVSVAAAQADMEVVVGRLAEAYPDDNMNRGVNVVPFYEQVVGEARPALLVLLGAVGLLLLVGCANVANLMLARAAGREKEIAIRATLGAGRRRLIGELLAESLMLALAGGALGVLLATWATRLILTLGPDDIFRMKDAGIDPMVLAFSLSISLLTGLVFGILPAFETSRPNLLGALKDGGRSSASREKQRLRGAIVIAEIAIAMILLVGAGLLIKSFILLSSVDGGFDPSRVLTARLWLNDSKYEEEGRITSTYTAVLERLKTVPGVEMASGVLGVPLSGTSANFDLILEGRPAPEGESFEAGFQSVAPDYFRTMGIPMLRGRDVRASDTEEAPRVAVVNETAARRFWPGEDAVGQRFSLGDDEWIEVVGVAGDVRHYGLDREPRAETFLPYPQADFPFMTVVLRTAGEPQALAKVVEREIAAVDPDLPVYKVMTMETLVSDSVSEPRFHSLMLAIFAGAAILLAAVGIYGLIAYSVGQRRQEIGIRMAMGADAGKVRRLILQEGLVLSLVGLGVGLLGALGLARLLSGMLFAVQPSDPATFAAVTALLLAVVLLASVVPAWRASRLDPLTALRHE